MDALIVSDTNSVNWATNFYEPNVKYLLIVSNINRTAHFKTFWYES